MSRITVVALLLLMLSAGCAAGSATRDAPTAQPQVFPSLAPVVPEPRPLGAVPACEMLTAAQVEALGADPASERNTVEGDPFGCQWDQAAGTGVLGASVRLPPIGLESLYLVRDAFEVFESGELAGFPIVRAGNQVEDDRDCWLYIGVSDEQMIEARASGVEPGQGCATARRMAEAMIANLPEPD